MGKLIPILVTLLSLVVLVDANAYREHWMTTNGISPDFMHYKAMRSRAKGHRVK